MAKQGFNYYKAETDRFQDIKIKRLKKKYHCTGYAVYQYVLNEIYRVRGYFLQFTEDHLFDVSEYWDIDEEDVTAIIGYCAEIGLFNAQLWQEKGVLTGRSIQVRYIDICKVCKKAAVIEEGFRLVPAEQAVPAPPPLPSLFPGEEFPAMRIVHGRMGAEAAGGSTSSRLSGFAVMSGCGIASGFAVASRRNATAGGGCGGRRNNASRHWYRCFGGTGDGRGAGRFGRFPEVSGNFRKNSGRIRQSY